MKAGFARLDMTPSVGTRMYGEKENGKYSEGVLDPLYATAVVFDDGENRAVVLSVELLGLHVSRADEARSMIAKAIGTDPSAVYIACTHIHTGPYGDWFPKGTDGVPEDYYTLLNEKLVEVSVLALQDAAPAKMFYTRGKAEQVAFVRRYRMKDGSVRTNPGGYQNPDVLEPMGLPDECVSNLILKREGKPEIGIVNFQVHPNVVSTYCFTADYPKFVRDTYEKLIDNSLCMYLNGCQGDTNHIDCMYLAPGQCRGGYERARYMGRKIAMAAVENYELAVELSGDKVSYGQKDIFVKVNKGTAEEIEEARQIIEQYEQGGLDAIVLPERYAKQKPSSVRRGAVRILANINMPDEQEMPLNAIAVGDVVFSGIPGEPFTDVGRGIKEKSKFTLTMPTCCTNGYMGYFPMSAAFHDGGYESLTARYVCGTAEQIIEESVELINSL